MLSVTFGKVIRGSGFANSSSKHRVEAELVPLNWEEVIWKGEIQDPNY